MDFNQELILEKILEIEEILNKINEILNKINERLNNDEIKVIEQVNEIIRKEIIKNYYNENWDRVKQSIIIRDKIREKFKSGINESGEFENER